MANEANPCPCKIGHKLDYQGRGEEVQIEHIKAYIVNPASSSETAIIVVHDIFGWQLPNTRYMADLLASNGYIAICPDFFVGKEPWNPLQPPTNMSAFHEWLEDKQPTNINREVDAVLKYLKEQCGASQIAAVGFCWGGIAVHHLALQYPQLKAGVSNYGIIRDVEDKYQLQFPTLFIFAEKDPYIPLDQMANEANPCPCKIGQKLDYQGRGEEVQIEHIKAYIVNPASSSETAIIVVQDIFGWQLPNTRYMADLLASNGYIAICPDFFVGKEPWNPLHGTPTDMSAFLEWLEDKQPTNINREVDAVLKYLKEQCGASQIAAVGFCWGGVAVHHLALQYPDLKAGVSNYGIIRDAEDKYQLQFPTLFIFAEKDPYVPLDQVTTLEKRLQEKCPVDFKVKVFPGQTHGFVHRKQEDINPSDTPSIEEARMDMVKWLKKYVEKC